MGQNNGKPAKLSEAEIEKLFAKLDIENKGYLTISELLIKHPPTQELSSSDFDDIAVDKHDLLTHHSIPALYHFDSEKEGKLTPIDFANLVQYLNNQRNIALRELTTDAKFRDLIKLASQRGVKDCSAHGREAFRRISHHVEIKSLFKKEEPHSKHVDDGLQVRFEVPETKQESKDINYENHNNNDTTNNNYYEYDGDANEENNNKETPYQHTTEEEASIFSEDSRERDKAVHMYGSQKFEDDEGRHVRSDSCRSSNSDVNEKLDNEALTALDAAVLEKLSLSSIKDLSETLRGKGQREEFMKWLWKLIDYDHQTVIQIGRLAVFLDAIQEDGINLEEFVFDKNPNKPLEERVMDEFDINRTKYLSRDEFMVLADLVTLEYEFWENRHMEHIGDYELGRNLGRGASGFVRSAVDTITHQKYAIKIIKKGNLNDLSRLDREIQALQVVSTHPHVVDLIEVLESEEHLFMVLELCGGGSLLDIVRLYPDEVMPEDVARHFVSQIFDALEYCHQNGVCHRDVRLDNMLVDNKGNMKITDFGHSGIYTPGWDIFSTTLVGSVSNLSPEQVSGQCYSGEKIDVWSAGVLVYTLLVGHPPFHDASCVDLLANITNAKFELPDTLSPEAKSLLKLMITADPEARPTIGSVRNHPWFVCGLTLAPVMDIVTIPIDPFYKKRPDLAEMILAGTIHEYNIHFHLGDSLKERDRLANDGHSAHGDDCEWSLKCCCPNMDMKFWINLIIKPLPQTQENNLTAIGSRSVSSYDLNQMKKGGEPDLQNQLNHKLMSLSKKLVADNGARNELDVSDGEDLGLMRISRPVTPGFTSVFSRPETPSILNNSRPTTPGLRHASRPRTPALPPKPHTGKVQSRRVADSFQPYIEVRLQEGESGLFLKICRRLKTLCDNKLTEAAMKQKENHRNRFRRGNSGGSTGMRKVPSLTDTTLFTAPVN